MATTAGLLGAAAVCLAFPVCGAFYDLVRCDSLWLFLVSAGLYSCCPGRPLTRIVLGALLLVLGFLTKQTAAPFMVAAAVSVTLTSGIKRGLVFSAVVFGGTTTAILVGQYLTHGWLWIYIYRLHQSHKLFSRESGPRRRASCSSTGSCSWFRSPRASCSWPSAQAVSKALPLGVHGGHGPRDGGGGQRHSGSVRQRVHSGRLLRSALVCGVCRRARSARRRPQGLDQRGFLVHSRAPRTLARIAAGLQSCGPGAAFGPCPDPLAGPVRPGPHPEGSRGSEAASETFSPSRGPEIFVPCHPFYSVLSGGSGHLHVMGVNDVYAWPRTITGDPSAGRSHQGALSGERDERLQIQALEDRHPGRLRHASASRAQHVLPPGRGPGSKREGPPVPDGVPLLATLCLGSAGRGRAAPFVMSKALRRGLGEASEPTGSRVFARELAGRVLGSSVCLVGVGPQAGRPGG